jgi:hypothetical protein
MIFFVGSLMLQKTSATPAGQSQNLYPDFKYFVKGIFKTEMPGFPSTIKMCFFMAIAFFLLLVIENRIAAQGKIGLLQPELVPFKKDKKYLPKKKSKSSLCKYE